MTDAVSWHGKLFMLSYTMFDSVPQEAPDGWAYWVVVIGTMIYCGIAAVIFVSLNICTLPFGIFAEPIWRPRATFRILHLGNGIPMMPFSVAIVLAYATWRELALRGVLMAFGAWVFVAALALLLLGLSMAYNRLRRNSASRPSGRTPPER